MSTFKVISSSVLGSFASSTHIQGSAYYGNYIILSHNNVGKPGLVIAFNATTGAYVSHVQVPSEGARDLTHCGGIQVAGDVVAVPIENSGTTDSRVVFYRMTVSGGVLTFNLLPLAIELPCGPAQGCGAAAIVNLGDRHLLLGYSASIAHVWTTNGLPLTDSGCVFTHLFDHVFTDITTTLGAGTPQGFGLWKRAADGGIYAVAMKSVDVKLMGITINYKDVALLYKLDLVGNKFTLASAKQLTFKNSSSITGVHFRYGAGFRRLTLNPPSESVCVMATQRSLSTRGTSGEYICIDSMYPL